MSWTDPKRAVRAPFRAVALAAAAVFALAGCETTPLGAHLDEGAFGDATANNIGIQNGEISFASALARRFAEEVPTTATFPFNSAVLDAQARAVLRQQAAFIRAFPEVEFTIYGHTDLVGSEAFNEGLGLRRARAALQFLVSEGVDRHRLDALVSLGETQPVVAAETRERRNRRTVTEVTGFVASHPLVLDGRYARIVYRAYAAPEG